MIATLLHRETKARAFREKAPPAANTRISVADIRASLSNFINFPRLIMSIYKLIRIRAARRFNMYARGAEI